MLSDYQMILHHFDEEVDIIPISDVHLGAIEHNANEWEEFLLKVKEEPKTYFILVGDLIQNNVRSAVGSPFEQVWRPMEQKDYDLSDQMTDYLTNFAKSGDPNGNGIPAWESADHGTLRIGEGETGMGKVSQMKLWYNLFTNMSSGE